MEGVMAMSKKFFDLDLQAKLDVSNEVIEGTEKKGYRGYFGLGKEDLENKDGTRDLEAEEGGAKQRIMKGDFKEGFDCGDEIADAEDARIKFFGQNLWPNEADNPSIVGFRSTLVKYQAALTELSDKLLLAFGRSLSDNPNVCDALPDDYFIRCTRRPMSTLRLLHYPPVKDGASTAQGCGAHTDYGVVTILQQDCIGGLQVRNRSHQWIDAKPLKSSFVINVGDMMSHWTAGEFASTVHRVVSPASSGDRYSVPFFFNPDAEAVVRPLNRGKALRNGEGFEAARTALEILSARYDGTFKK